MNKKLIIALIAICVAIGATSCQTYTCTEYFEKLHPETREQLIKKYIKRSGVPNWSDDKEFNISGAKI